MDGPTVRSTSSPLWSRRYYHSLFGIKKQHGVNGCFSMAITHSNTHLSWFFMFRLSHSEPILTHKPPQGRDFSPQSLTAF